MSAADQFQSAIEALADQTRTAALQLHARGLARTDLVNQVAALVNRANAQAVTLADLYTTAQLEELTGLPSTHIGLPPTDEFDRLRESLTEILDQPVKSTFTRAEIRELMESADLNPNQWDVPEIQKRVNGWVRDMLPDAEGIVPEESSLSFEDFIEIVSEHPRTRFGVAPIPGSRNYTRRYQDWLDLHDIPELDSDDYADREPIWEREPDGVLSRLERLAGNEPLQAAQRAAGNILAQHAPPTGHFYGWTRQLNAGACKLCQWWAKDGRVFPANHGMARHVNCACTQRIMLTTNKPRPVRRRRTK